MNRTEPAEYYLCLWPKFLHRPPQKHFYTSPCLSLALFQLCIHVSQNHLSPVKKQQKALSLPLGLWLLSPCRATNDRLWFVFVSGSADLEMLRSTLWQLLGKGRSSPWSITPPGQLVGLQTQRSICSCVRAEPAISSLDCQHENWTSQEPTMNWPVERFQCA